MTPEVKAIADALDVRIDDASWDATYIGIERYEENGPQWVRLEVSTCGEGHLYQIARKEMVKAWIAIDQKGVSDVDGMKSFIDGSEWLPVSTAIHEIDRVRYVELILQAMDGSRKQVIRIDHKGLVAAYFALRSHVELLEDAREAFAYLSKN